MVNLRAYANPVTSVINPNTLCEHWRNTGAETAPTGRRAPVFKKTPVMVQVQAMDAEDLKQIENQNQQGIYRKVYAYRQVAAIVRAKEKGGDLLVFPAGVLPEGTTWLCTHTLERWPDWCTFAITLQTNNYEAFKC